MDKKQVSVLSLLDLSAAFDTIDHSILFRRLEESFGICDTVLAWFRSYLTGRCQRVTVNGTSSENSPLTCGVPQGSVLGPVIFIMYTKPISDVISKHSIKHECFADDTQLVKSGRLDELPEVISKTQNCISDLKSWMSSNKLQLNEDKTDVMLVVPPSMRNDPSIPTSLTIGDTSIEFSTQVRNLGVTFDHTLSFEQHVKNVCRNAYLELRKISAIRHFLTTDATKVLICSLVLSRLDYGNSLLAGSYKYLIAKLEKVQKNAARLITKASKREPSEELFRSLHWLPIQNRIKYKVASICASFFLGTGPAYLGDMLTRYSNLPKLRSASDRNQLHNTKRELTGVTFGERAFRYQGPLIWGSLPQDLREKPTLSSFKASLKTHLFRS
jgi:hypothetical protein